MWHIRITKIHASGKRVKVGSSILLGTIWHDTGWFYQSSNKWFYNILNIKRKDEKIYKDILLSMIWYTHTFILRNKVSYVGKVTNIGRIIKEKNLTTNYNEKVCKANVKHMEHSKYRSKLMPPAFQAISSPLLHIIQCFSFGKLAIQKQK